MAVRRHEIDDIPALVAAAILAAGIALRPAAATLVPPGNRYPRAAAGPRRLDHAHARRGKTTFEAKYRKVYKLLKNDAEAARQDQARPPPPTASIRCTSSARSSASTPTMSTPMTGCRPTMSRRSPISMQRYRFRYDGEDVDDFVQRPQFSACADAKRTATICGPAAKRVWDREFRGKTVGGTRLSERPLQRDVLPAVLCRPDLRPRPAEPADGAADERHRATASPACRGSTPAIPTQRLQDDHGSGPDAALCRGDAEEVDRRLQVDRRLRHFRNPGLTATLYNVGNPEARAHALKAENDERASSSGRAAKLPEENYYGWLVNEKLPELQALF